MSRTHFKIGIQVNFMIIDINLNSPKITAMGVFEIGPNLFPSVIIDLYTVISWPYFNTFD